MSHPSPAAVSSSNASGQSDVTSTSQMNGVITSESRDSAERSPAAAAAAADGGDVIKSSLLRPHDAVSCADVSNTVQQNDVNAAAVDGHG